MQPGKRAPRQENSNDYSRGGDVGLEKVWPGFKAHLGVPKPEAGELFGLEFEVIDKQ